MVVQASLRSDRNPIARVRISTLSALAGLAALVSSSPVYAGESKSRRLPARPVAIASGPLDQALDILARRFGADLLYDQLIVRGRRASQVSGTMGFEAALASMLAGSGIAFVRTQDGVYVLRRSRAAPPPQARPQARPQPIEPEFEEEIVVTARKRHELFASVPLPITVVNRERLSAIGATSALDIVPYAPGLFFAEQGQLRPGRVDTAIRFRGMSINTANPQEQLASVFVDGVYVSTGIQGIIMDDMERVEVINGPQSGLFGRSTFGGAVNFVTREPGQVPLARAHLRASASGDADLNASIEGALFSDVVVGRVSGRFMRRAGDFENPVHPSQRLGRQSTKSVAGDLRLFTGQFKAAARLLYSRDDDGAPAAWGVGVFEADCGPFNGGTRRTICGNLPTVGEARFGQNTRDTNLLSRGSDYGLDRKMFRGHLRMSLGLAPANLEIASLTGFNRERKTILNDGDFGPDPVFTQAYAAKFTDFSQELRVGTRQKSRINWSLGASYFGQNYKETVSGVYDAFANPFNYDPFCNVAPVDCDPATKLDDSPEGDLSLGTNPFFSGNVRTRALFASAEFDVLPQITAGLEGRYEWDSIDAGESNSGKDLKKTFPALLYRAIISARPMDRLTLYALHSTGNLPGGFNSSVINASGQTRLNLLALGARDTLPQQRLRNFEAGVRFNAPNLKLSLSAYHMLWQKQRFRRTYVNPDTGRTTTYFDAAGASVLKGAEIQATWTPSPRATIEFNGNWASARYRSLFSTNALRILGDGDVSGNHLPSFPEWSGAVSGTLTGKFTTNLSWSLRADLIYRGKIYADEVNLATIPARTTVNLRAGLKRNKVRFDVFATNLFNSRAIDFAGPQADISAYKPAFDLTQSGFIASPTPERKIGIELSTDF